MYVRVHNVQLVQLSITLPTVKKSCIRVYCIYTVYIYKQYIIPDELCTCIFVLAYRKGNKWSVWGQSGTMRDGGLTAANTT